MSHSNLGGPLNFFFKLETTKYCNSSLTKLQRFFSAAFHVLPLRVFFIERRRCTVLLSFIKQSDLVGTLSFFCFTPCPLLFLFNPLILFLFHLFSYSLVPFYFFPLHFHIFLCFPPIFLIMTESLFHLLLFFIIFPFSL